MIPASSFKEPAHGDDERQIDASAINTAAAASAAPYRSFADATRSVLDLLERLMPGCALYLSHLDRTHSVHRIVDTRGGGALGLRATFDAARRLLRHREATSARRGSPTTPQRPGLRRRPDAAPRRPGSYLGVPLELTDGSRVGALAALCELTDRFRAEDEQLFTMLARVSVLGFEFERETNERDLQRLNDSLREHARGMGAVGRVVAALATGADSRAAVCRAACEMAGAPVTFLLEPSGREFVSTAMSGIEMAPVTIQPRADTTGRAFTARESYFVSDARAHPALAQPLVDATSARSALFEPVLRDGHVCGVLIVIWRRAIPEVPESTSGMLRLLAAQAAVAIEHSGLRARVETLSLTDELTGVATRRVFDDELPRKLARARRGEHPLSIALLDLDHLRRFQHAARGARG